MTNLHVKENISLSRQSPANGLAPTEVGYRIMIKGTPMVRGRTQMPLMRSYLRTAVRLHKRTRPDVRRKSLNNNDAVSSRLKLEIGSCEPRTTASTTTPNVDTNLRRAQRTEPPTAGCLVIVVSYHYREPPPAASPSQSERRGLLATSRTYTKCPHPTNAQREQRRKKKAKE